MGSRKKLCLFYSSIVQSRKKDVTLKSNIPSAFLESFATLAADHFCPSLVQMYDLNTIVDRVQMNPSSMNQAIIHSMGNSNCPVS